MKYTQNRDESGEILRMALQKMAAQPAAFTPPNYTVWYECLAGINPGLNEAVNANLALGRPLGDDDIDKLYLRFISSRGLDAERVLRDDIQKLLIDLAGFTAETDRQALDFGNSLQAYGDSLKQNLSAASLEDLINRIAKDTGKMRGSVQRLQTELAASKQLVEKLHRELESARSEALIDPLTGILNRRGLESKAQQLFGCDAAAKGLSLLMLDIDHFKAINDTYGHLFGDKVLRIVADTIKASIKGQDTAVRLGGEEFVVVLPGTPAAGAHAVAEQIRRSIEHGKIRRLDAQEPVGGITLSVGVASHADGGSLTELLDQADKALYASKKNGRNRTTVFGAA